MTVYVMRKGRLVDKSRVAPRGAGGVSIISDEMEPTRHMADGNYYTSKAKFRGVTRAHSCVEVGNDPAIFRPRKATMPTRSERRAAIRNSIRTMLREGIPR